jgi:hypothetical protein
MKEPKMTATKFTVTHTDGTVSTRTSKTKAYTHAVVSEQTAEARRDDYLEIAAGWAARAEKSEAAAEATEVLLTSDRRDYRGKALYSWTLGGLFVGLDSKPAPSLEEARATVLGYAARERSNQRAYEAKAAAATETVYTVLRWSQSHDNAAKFWASKEAQHFARYGRVSVVPVDGQA